MEEMSFEELVDLACRSTDPTEQTGAARRLERDYGFEIHCPDIHPSVLFAHHGRGCTIAAAKLSKGVAIYQNVTIGSNLKYDKDSGTWGNIGSPILGENVVVADGAKILGPVVIGDNSVIGAGAIITRDIPADSVAYGVNRFKPKEPGTYLVFGPGMPSGEEIAAADAARVAEYERSKSLR